MRCSGVSKNFGLHLSLADKYIFRSGNLQSMSKKLSSNAMNLAEKYTWQAKASNFIKLIQTNIN